MLFAIQRLGQTRPQLVPAAAIAVQDLARVEPTDRRALCSAWLRQCLHGAEMIAGACADAARRTYERATTLQGDAAEAAYAEAEQWDALAEEVRSVGSDPSVSAA